MKIYWFFNMLYHVTRFAFLKFYLKWFTLFFCFTGFAQAGVTPPVNVSATIYSSTAIEIFWEPASYPVQISRNGENLGTFDTLSRFEPNLQQSKSYLYELRSVNAIGQLSLPVVLSVSTEDLSSPLKRIWPVSANAIQESVNNRPDIDQDLLMPPINVSALIYSTSAIELFWEPREHSVKISRNGELVGRFETRSLFQSNLEPNKTYHYKLESINSKGTVSTSVIVSLRTANFSLPIKRVWPVDQNEVTPAPPQVAQPITTIAVAAIPANNISNSDSNDIVQGENNCIARDVNSLLDCVRNVDAYQRIDIVQNIRCDDNCCPNGAALLRFNRVQNLDVNGHGHSLLRSNNQRQCSLLDIDNSMNLAFHNLKLDDDKNDIGCQVAQNCPRMVHVKQSKNIEFVDAHISHGKGYAFYVQGTDGFRFDRSSLHNSGVLGMYIGHGSDVSSNIQITNSTFSDNQTNGLALLGVAGQTISSNVIANNTFVRNHWRGQWAVAPQYGTGLTGGGQLYIAEASNVTVRNNAIKDGYCIDCFVQQKFRSGVSGIELGIPNQRSLSHILVTDNTVHNSDAWGILQNSNSSLASNVSVSNNKLFNTTRGENLKDANKSNNWIIDTQQFNSFESQSELSSRFRSNVSCSTNGSVSRQCGGDTLYGQCAIELTLGQAECSDSRVSIEGPKEPIRPGQTAILNGWVKSAVGRWCAVFQDASGNSLSEQCIQLSTGDRSDVQPYVGLPTIEANAPEGSAYVHLYVEHRQANVSMRLDDLILSVGSGR